jgi:hypothetical protein
MGSFTDFRESNPVDVTMKHIDFRKAGSMSEERFTVAHRRQQDVAFCVVLPAYEVPPGQGT